MIRSLSAAAALAALASLAATSVFAATAASAPAGKTKTTKSKKAAAPAADPVEAPDDNLNPAQLSIADRVLTGVAACEFKEKVDVERLPGHSGNFVVTYDKKSYTMVPEETTTGAIRLVDTGGSVIWVQIPSKSMLMNQKIHQRMVDDCQEDEQRIATQSAMQAGANAPALAPSVAAPAAVAAAIPAPAAPAAPMAVDPATAVSVVPAAPVVRSAQAPDAAASGMWK